MKTSPTTMKISTFGRFNISVDGSPVAIDWADETIKVLFCSFLSPQHRCIPWEKLCRLLWNVPATRRIQTRIKDLFLQPLITLLWKETMMNLLVVCDEGIGIDTDCVSVDAHDFFHEMLEGLRHQSDGNYKQALISFQHAAALYTGPYLPGIPGKIIDTDRIILGKLYDQLPQSIRALQNSGTYMHAGTPQRVQFA